MLLEKLSIKTIFMINLMIILVFATIYIIVASFGDQFNHTSKTLNFIDALYFSFSVQTNIGFGDITPKSSLAKIIVMLQQITSLFNSAVVVSKAFPNLSELFESIKGYGLNKNLSSTPSTSTPSTSTPSTSTPPTSTPPTSTVPTSTVPTSTVPTSTPPTSTTLVATTGSNNSDKFSFSTDKLDYKAVANKKYKYKNPNVIKIF